MEFRIWYDLRHTSWAISFLLPVVLCIVFLAHVVVISESAGGFQAEFLWDRIYDFPFLDAFFVWYAIGILKSYDVRYCAFCCIVYQSYRARVMDVWLDTKLHTSHTWQSGLAVWRSSSSVFIARALFQLLLYSLLSPAILVTLSLVYALHITFYRYVYAWFIFIVVLFNCFILKY